MTSSWGARCGQQLSATHAGCAAPVASSRGHVTSHSPDLGRHTWGHVAGNHWY